MASNFVIEERYFLVVIGGIICFQATQGSFDCNSVPCPTEFQVGFQA